MGFKEKKWKIKEQIAILNKNELKEFNFLRDEVKYCGGMESRFFIENVKNDNGKCIGEIYANFTSDYALAAKSIVTNIYPENNDDDVEIKLLKSIEIKTEVGLEGQDVIDFYALKLF